MSSLFLENVALSVNSGVQTSWVAFDEVTCGDPRVCGVDLDSLTVEFAVQDIALVHESFTIFEPGGVSGSTVDRPLVLSASEAQLSPVFLEGIQELVMACLLSSFFSSELVSV